MRLLAPKEISRPQYKINPRKFSFPAHLCMYCHSWVHLALAASAPFRLTFDAIRQHMCKDHCSLFTWLPVKGGYSGLIAAILDLFLDFEKATDVFTTSVCQHIYHHWFQWCHPFFIRHKWFWKYHKPTIDSIYIDIIHTTLQKNQLHGSDSWGKLFL